jgi:RNA exonuclease 1
MLQTLYNHFAELYSDIAARHPKLAAEHSLAQEEELYTQSSQHSYRNVSSTDLYLHVIHPLQIIINACTRLKKRSKPTSITHASVGTESQIAKKLEEQKSLQAFRLTTEHLEPLLLTSEQETLLGYVTAVPDGPGGDRPHSEDQDLPCCDRCKKGFRVIADPTSTACEHHWGKSYHVKVPGEKERQRVYRCCSQPAELVDPCSKGPHVFVEKDPVDLHARVPFVETSGEHGDVTDVVALDCEMIYSTAGLSLARVSVVDGQGELLLDEFVRMDDGVAIMYVLSPPSAQWLNSLSDFNTRFSGVSSLDSAKLDLREIRRVLSSYISSKTIIVGHALDNDLKALRLVHRRCIDTCALFPHPGGLPYRRALRDLCVGSPSCISYFLIARQGARETRKGYSSRREHCRPLLVGRCSGYARSRKVVHYQQTTAQTSESNRGGKVIYCSRIY